MNKVWIQESISERLGGACFEQKLPYKFEAIKQAKCDFIEKNPKLPLLDFGIGEPQEVPMDCAIHAMKEACGVLEYNGYADNGAAFFKESVMEFMQSELNVALTQQEILPILGIKSGLALLAGALINPGDYVACTVPGYGVFSTQTAYFGGNVYALPLKEENHFLPDLEAIPEEQKRKIKIISLNYPNNPTGAVASDRFYEKLVSMALHYHWIIVQDAAYGTLSFEKPLSILQVPEAKQCCVELHSMSKGFNMTGWRLGWMCGNATLIKACSFYKNNCDSGQFLPIQKGAQTALRHAGIWLRQQRVKYENRLKNLERLLSRKNFHCCQSKAGFFLYVLLPKKITSKHNEGTMVFKTAEDFSAWLLKTLGICTVAWDEVGHYLRFAVTFPEQEEASIFAELEKRLSPFVFES